MTAMPPKPDPFGVPSAGRMIIWWVPRNAMDPRGPRTLIPGILSYEFEMYGHRHNQACEEPEHDKGEDAMGILHCGPARWYIKINHDVCCPDLGIEIEAVCDGVVDWLGSHGEDMVECNACHTHVAVSEFATILGGIDEYPGALG